MAHRDLAGSRFAGAIQRDDVLADNPLSAILLLVTLMPAQDTQTPRNAMGNSNSVILSAHNEAPIARRRAIAA